MALKKKIKMPNGIELEYHRIALLTVDVNNQVTILRHSYLTEDARQYEKDYAAGLIKDDPVFPFIDHEYMHIDYIDGIDIRGAYEWLKSQPDFLDSEDV